MIKEFLVSFITPVFDFIKINFIEIIATIISAVFFYAVYRFMATSLKKLRTEIFSSYPFDLFFPASGGWSIGYFLLVIIFLGLLIIFMVKGNFVAGPA